MLRKKVAANQPIKISMKYFISVPMENVYLDHLTGLSGIFAQKLHPLVSQKILEMVKSGITDTREIKHSLKHHVDVIIIE